MREKETEKEGSRPHLLWNAILKYNRGKLMFEKVQRVKKMILNPAVLLTLFMCLSFFPPKNP